MDCCGSSGRAGSALLVCDGDHMCRTTGGKMGEVAFGRAHNLRWCNGCWSLPGRVKGRKGIRGFLGDGVGGYWYFCREHASLVGAGGEAPGDGGMNGDGCPTP